VKQVKATLHWFVVLVIGPMILALLLLALGGYRF
jgi:hypothetical protein